MKTLLRVAGLVAGLLAGEAGAADILYSTYLPTIPTASMPGVTDYYTLVQGGAMKKVAGTSLLYNSNNLSDVANAATALGNLNGLSRALASGNIFVGSGGVAVAAAPSGDVASIGPTGTFALQTTGVLGTSCTNCNLTYDPKGRITVASNGSGGTGGISGLTTGQLGIAGSSTTLTSSVPFGATGNSTVVETDSGGHISNTLITGLPAANIATGTSGATLGLLNANLTFSGGLHFTGLVAGTQVSCLGLDNTNTVVPLNGACNTGAGAAVSITAADKGITITPSPLTGTGTIGTAVQYNTQAGASYTLVPGDAGGVILRTNGSAQTDTLPDTGTTGFGAGWSAILQTAAAGDTLSRTTASTINNLTSIKLGAYQAASLTSAATNVYYAMLGVPQPPGQAGTTVLRDDMTWATFGTAGAAATGTSGHTLPYLDGSNTWSGTQTLGSTVGSINAQPSATTYTLTASDCGQTIRFGAATAVTVTTLNSLVAGCSIAVLQAGAGQVTIAAGAGTTFHSVNTYTKTKAQYAIVGLFVDTNVGGAAADYIMTGDGV